MMRQEHKFEASLGYRKKQANKPLSLPASVTSSVSDAGGIHNYSLTENFPNTETVVTCGGRQASVTPAPGGGIVQVVVQGQPQQCIEFLYSLDYIQLC